jgi:hypothetical protein
MSPDRTIHGGTSPSAPLCDQLTHLRDGLDGHVHRSSGPDELSDIGP